MHDVFDIYVNWYYTHKYIYVFVNLLPLHHALSYPRMSVPAHTHSALLPSLWKLHFNRDPSHQWEMLKGAIASSDSRPSREVLWGCGTSWPPCAEVCGMGVFSSARGPTPFLLQLCVQASLEHEVYLCSSSPVAFCLPTSWMQNLTFKRQCAYALGQGNGTLWGS